MTVSIFSEAAVLKKFMWNSIEILISFPVQFFAGKNT